MAAIKQINGAFFGFLLGSVIGGSIALVNATKPKQLRDDTKTTTKELYEDNKKSYEYWNDAKEKAESVVDSANIIRNSHVFRIPQLLIY